MIAPEEEVGSNPDGASAGRTTALIVLLRIASMGLIFLGSVALARGLGPDGRGAHGFVVSLTMLLAAVLAIGAPVGGYVLIRRGDQDVQALAGGIAWFAILAGVVGLASVEGLHSLGLAPAPLEGVPAWSAMVAVAIAGYVLVSHQIQLAFGRGRAVTGAILVFAPFTIAAIGYLLVLLIRGGLTLAIAAFVVAPWVTVAVGALLRGRPVILRLALPSPSGASRQVRQGMRTYPGELAVIAHQRADVLLLGLLAPAAALGVYVVAYQTAEPILVLSSAASAAVLAQHPGQDAGMKPATVERLLREVLLVGLGVGLVATAAAPIVIPAVYGPAYAEAVLPFAVLLPAVIALSIGRIATADLVRRDRLGVTASYAIVGLVVNVGANVLLIPRYGAVGAALASLISYSTFTALALAADRAAGGFEWGHIVPRVADAKDLILAIRPAKR